MDAKVEVSVPSFGAGWVSGAITGGLLASIYFLSRPSSSSSSFRHSQHLLPDPIIHSKDIEDLERLFHIPPIKLQQLFNHFLSEMKQGLTEKGSTMKMIPSFLDSVPTGYETGSFLALDLGGTNFRVVRVLLEGSGNFKTEQKKYLVDDEIKTGEGEKLFDFLAECIEDFMKEFDMDLSQTYNLGFTFSFPCKQTAINSGILFEWTKGFSASGVEGKDVVELLGKSIKKKNLKIDVVALVNDTVGTLAAHCYKESQCYIGVIFGTGTNAAYIEKTSEIPKWKGEDKTGKMVINMEWGSFDDRKMVLPLTPYDIALDRDSPNPGKQLYEKMISGMYLGEITRLICLEMIRKGTLFGGKTSEKFETPHSFDTAYMSRIERDHSKDLYDTGNVLEDVLGIGNPDHGSRHIVKRVCELVGVRAARLSAVGIAAVVAKIGKTAGCEVAVDGSVFRYYPHFQNRVRDALTEIFGLQADNITFAVTQDGSGVGAALVAACAKPS